MQITRTTPRRLTILHLSQIRLTDALTFMTLRFPDDPAARHIPRRELYDYAITDQQSHEIPFRPVARMRRNPRTVDLDLIQPTRQLRPDHALDPSQRLPAHGLAPTLVRTPLY